MGRAEMKNQKKEITSLIDKCYAKLLRRLLTAFTLQSVVSYNLESDDLDEVISLISSLVSQNLKASIEKENSSDKLLPKKLDVFLESVNWKSLSKKYCKSLDQKKDKDPIDIDAIYQLTEKYHRLEFNDYDWTKIAIDLASKYPPIKISIQDIVIYADQDDIYNSKNTKAELASDWYEASCEKLGLLGVFETKEEAKACFDLYKKHNPNLNDFKTKAVRCLPPGKYFIGDISVLLDDYENELKYPSGRDVYQLEDGTVFANFSTWGGDGVFEDELGWQYLVDSGTLGVIPIKSLPKELRKVKSGGGQRVKIFKHPAICSYNVPVEGCIKIGDTYIFTSLEEVSKEMKKSLFLDGYQRNTLLDKRKSEEGKPNENYIYGYKVEEPLDQLKPQTSTLNTQSKEIEIDRSILKAYDLEKLKLPNFRNTLKNDIPIQDLNLSARPLTILKRFGFEYINDLSGLEYFDFLEMRNLGSKATDEIIIRLHEKGYISEELNSNILEEEKEEQEEREVWSIGDKLIHNVYGPGRLIGKKDEVIVVRFEQLKTDQKTYQINPYIPEKINQIISKKIYPYTFLNEQSSLKVVKKISEEKYHEMVSSKSDSFKSPREVEVPYGAFEKEWIDIFDNIPSNQLFSNVEDCIGSLVELFNRHKKGIEVLDDQNNPLNEDFFIKRIDHALKFIKESLESNPKVVWINKYGETPPKVQPIEILSLSTRTYNCLKRSQINSLSELALMRYDDFRPLPGMGVIGPDEILERFEDLGFLMKPNDHGQKLKDFCPDYRWANRNRLHKLGFDLDRPRSLS